MGGAVRLEEGNDDEGEDAEENGARTIGLVDREGRPLVGELVETARMLRKKKRRQSLHAVAALQKIGRLRRAGTRRTMMQKVEKLKEKREQISKRIASLEEKMQHLGEGRELRRECRIASGLEILPPSESAPGPGVGEAPSRLTVEVSKMLVQRAGTPKKARCHNYTVAFGTLLVLSAGAGIVVAAIAFNPLLGPSATHFPMSPPPSHSPSPPLPLLPPPPPMPSPLSPPLPLLPPPPPIPCPPPPPPQVPPGAPPNEPPQSAAEAVAAELNARFTNGVPSNNLTVAGVLVHTFDFQLTADPWVPRGANGRTDRVSASLFNQRLPYMFKGHGFGLVLEPTHTKDTLWCAWALDAGTTGKAPCDRICAEPNGGRVGGYCPWAPQHLIHMLEQHELRHGARFNNGWHNEVVLHAAAYVAAMPRIVQAFFATSDETYASARVVRATFAEHFELERHAIPPLLRLNLSRTIPFEIEPHADTGMNVVSELNRRFAHGHPSNAAAEAGVFFRGLDALTGASGSADPWNVYWPHSRQPINRVSGCIMNARLPYLFMRAPWGRHEYDNAPPGPEVGAGGFFVKPGVVEAGMICSYSHDASTTNDRSGNGCGRGDAFASVQLAEMLAAHERRSLQCSQAGNINNCYNEVLLSASVWNANLPDLVEAMGFPRGSARAEHEARLTHALFLKNFGAEVPLIEIALRNDTQDGLNPQPFSLAEA